MADWKQIQARIRKAKNSSDPLAKLLELFAKTRDAMVAFEAAAIEEKAGRNDEAVRWYTTAAERFRRAEWKKKAEEALTHLGAPIPASIAATPAEELHAAGVKAEESREAHAEDHAAEASASAAPLPPAESGQTAEQAPATGHKRRRRGRRGGRGRRRGAAAATPALPEQTFAQPAAPSSSGPRPAASVAERVTEEPARGPIETSRAARIEPEPEVGSKRSAHGRAGEPALASRLNHLEALLRRLVSSPVHRLEEADEAPAGPGVFLISDSDLVTSYYVESCQTLRVGLGHVVRGSRSSRSTGGAMRARLAEYLGISEAKVSQYLKQHCAVRWIQLDEDAAHLAHFAIAVLRTPLNIE